MLIEYTWVPSQQPFIVCITDLKMPKKKTGQRKKAEKQKARQKDIAAKQVVFVCIKEL